MEEKEKTVPNNDIHAVQKIEENNQEITTAVPKNMGDFVANAMQSYMEKGLVIPSDYNIQNAITASYLIIKQDPKLNTCAKDSIASTLLDMAVMGLNASKKQCYFIPYDGKLQLSPSYFGKIMAIKRIRGVIDVRADIIYKDTEYELFNDEFGNDDIKIINPCPLESRNFDNLIGAWCRIVLDEDVWGSKSYVCLMTMDQIRKSWNQGAMKGQSPAHKNFTDEMAKKSVINRCCKNFVNSAKDNDILIDTLNRTIDNDYTNEDGKPVNKLETKIIDFE